MKNGLAHHYYLGESTVILRAIRCDFEFLFYFSMSFLEENRIAPDGMPHSAASHMGLFCFSMSHKKDTRLKFTFCM